MSRFVLLRHELPQDADRASHFDLMLECNAYLRTWAMNQIPTAGEPIAAIELPDHRIDYLEYEGPVSNNRGSVSRVDHGQFEFTSDGDERIEIEIAGQILRGAIVLIRHACDWRLSYQPSTKRNKA